MKLPRFPATRSPLPPGSPRRAALMRAEGALAAALVLLVLGLLDRDRSALPPPLAGEALGAMAPGGASSTRPVGPGVAALPLAAAPSTERGAASLAAAAPVSSGAGADAAAAPSCPAPASAAPPSTQPAASAQTPDGILLPRAAVSPIGPGYLVQLGVFAAPDNALRIYLQATAAGQPAHIQSRVVLGPFADRDAAERARKRLQAAGAGAGVLVSPERSR